MRIFGLLIVFGILLATAVIAGEGKTTLLATSDPFEGGITASLSLETKPGTGKIFIESSPLTKVDTQISTRFAKEVACNYLGQSCDDLDFFYTIKARATIIGGPSAGAAMAALTIAVLEGAEFNESVAITGTINSGNIVGVVGGVSEKIEAAGNAGITKVLIPKGEQSSFARNASVDVIALGKDNGVEVVEVFSLDEVMLEFTGKTFAPPEEDIEIDSRYSTVMKQLASNLCQRTDKLASSISQFADSEDYNESYEGATQIAQNLSIQGSEARKENSNYAAASFCFGANVRYKYLELSAMNPDGDKILEGLNDIEEQVTNFEADIQNITTVSDAQILAVVLDRIMEARNHINASRTVLALDDKDRSVFELAFSIERLESAKSWSRFFGEMPELEVSTESLKNACLQKIGEAEERVEYSAILIRSASDSSRTRLGQAQQFLDDENYVQCLHRATIAKAEASILLSVVGVREEEIDGIVERKLDAAKTIIARQSNKEIFPVVGYSYYEYANSLQGDDRFSALLFSEYALEFSNLDIYFKSERKPEEVSSEPEKADIDILLRYIIGLLIIVGILSFVAGRKSRKRKRILINRPKKVVKRRKRA